MKGLEIFSRQWEESGVALALIGPTGQLKKTLECVVTENEKGFKIEMKVSPSVRGYNYALRQSTRILGHVNKGSVGKIGFQTFGKGRTRLQKYRSGYRRAVKGTHGSYEKYRYNYPRLSYEKIGGLKELLKAIREGLRS